MNLNPSVAVIARTEPYPTSGYGVNDIYYRLYSEMANGELTVDLGIDNVFDKAYTKRFAFLLEEGRSFNARASYKW